MRGSRQGWHIKELMYRSIPASAGQPGTEYVCLGCNTVYPRECGAAFERFGLNW